MRTEKTNVPHVEWIELHGDGLMHECAIMKKDVHGNMHFIEIAKLDRIDKGRLSKILSSRNATQMELWNLMGDVTLNNGVNALSYFHQLVRVISPNGTIYNPRSGVIGASTSVRTTEGKAVDTQMGEHLQEGAQEEKAPKKGPFGRPVKE